MVTACGGSVGQPASTPTPVPTLPRASGGGPKILPLVAGAEFAAGPTRFLFSITDRDDRLLAASGTRVRLASYEVAADPEAVVFESDSRFLWAVEDVSCLPVANDSLPSGGRRGTRFWATFPDGRTETIRLHLATASGVAVVHRTEGSRHIVLRLGDAHWVGR